MLQVRNREWKAARARSDDLNSFIVNSSGTATLEDVRRSVHTFLFGLSAGRFFPKYLHNVCYLILSSLSDKKNRIRHSLITCG